MILLRPDYLLFQTSGGDAIPCSAELVAVELIGEAIHRLDAEVVRQAATAVLHHFSQDLGYTTVSVGEFADALETALRTLGISVSSAHPESTDGMEFSDLRKLASGSGKAFELSFFPKLRDELRARLESCPRKVRFFGLRDCVKELAGTRRWNRRCQALNDQIVEFLRDCMHNEAAPNSCDVVIC
jgi:hypothetical protein